MTLEEYLNSLIKLADENPHALKMPVVYAADDEGNGYTRVHYTPTIGEVEDSEANYNDYFNSAECPSVTPNVVCIN